MRLSRIKIRNFRAHVSTDLSVSSFGCLIGENNAGKSSVLHALHFALKGSPPGKLSPSDFHDPTEPLSVEFHLDEVTDEDLLRITDEEHRTRTREMLVGSSLQLIRIAAPNDRPVLRTFAQVPGEDRWLVENLDPVMKGKRNEELRAAIVAQVPELEEVLSDKPTMIEARTKLAEFVEQLPPENFRRQPVPLKNGIDNALKPLLPEVIYIEAVKDATAETKTAETATFGKLLKVLLDEVADQFADIEESFRDIHRRLSRQTGVDGVEDNRLAEVKLIETTIESFVRESFPGVGLEVRVPAPELRSILGSAEIDIDDGHRGGISSKGDGLKRTVAFAILRAYTALKDRGLKPEGQAIRRSRYLLLFEEPELYLHPRAQHQLFAALTAFSKDHPVLVTTHSPVFLNASATGSFARLRKVDETPGVEVVDIDLQASLSQKDALQLICHENNEAALFARAIVLVEGDSDAVVLPHLARLLDPAWDHIDHGIVFIRTGGKSNIARYRSFFALFDVPVFAIGDLDVMLEGFEKFTGGAGGDAIRQSLLKEVDSLLAAEPEPLKSKNVDSFRRKSSALQLWGQAQTAFDALEDAPSLGDLADLQAILGQLFDLSRGRERLTLLADQQGSLAEKKRAINVQLHQEGGHILERGAIESYYGAPGLGSNKVEAAEKLKASTKTLDQFLDRHGDEKESVSEELRLVFTAIFRSAGPRNAGPSTTPLVRTGDAS